MKRARALLSILSFACSVFAGNHGPVFGLATPVNSQGEWSFDTGLFGRSAAASADVSLRELIAYGFTPHLTVSFTVPLVLGGTPLPPTRIQPGADFETGVAWRFQHRVTRVGARLESTAFATIIAPGSQSAFKGVAHTSNAPGAMLGAVSGLASRSHYLWLGATYTKFYQHNGDRRPDVLDYSLVYGYRPSQWRKEPDKWDWRLFAELVGERSERFLVANQIVPGTQAHQVFLGPTALGIHRNYTISFGAQFPLYRATGVLFPRERVRYALNFSYLLFNKHTK